MIKTTQILALLLLACIPANAQEPMIVAHRGASKDAPENTLPAFRLAWKQGADGIEGDFHLTKDGHIVCIHDGSTKKYASKNLTVSKSTLAELRNLDVGSYHGQGFAGTKIPTIAEVFSTVPAKKKIYIEVKCGPEIIPALLAEIKSSGLKREQIIVISFKHQVIQQIKAKAPQYKAYWLSSFRKGRFGKITPSLKTVLATLQDIKADGFSSSKNNISENFVQGVLQKEYEYHVWTVDDVNTAKRFAKWGAKSITTNVPGVMIDSFSKRRATATP